MRLLLALILLVTAGCTAIEENEARQQRIWLEKAGFRIVGEAPGHASPVPERDFLAAVHPNGKVTFYYIDPTNRSVFAGSEQAMAAYREISVRDRARRAANLARMTPGSTRIRGPMVW